MAVVWQPSSANYLWARVIRRPYHGLHEALTHQSQVLIGYVLVYLPMVAFLQATTKLYMISFEYLLVHMAKPERREIVPWSTCHTSGAAWSSLFPQAPDFPTSKLMTNCQLPKVRRTVNTKANPNPFINTRVLTNCSLTTSSELQSATNSPTLDIVETCCLTYSTRLIGLPCRVCGGNVYHRLVCLIRRNCCKTKADT